LCTAARTREWTVICPVLATPLGRGRRRRIITPFSRRTRPPLTGFPTGMRPDAVSAAGDGWRAGGGAKFRYTDNERAGRRQISVLYRTN